MSALALTASAVFVAAGLIMTAGLVWLRRRLFRGKRAATGPSWDRPTHLHTVVWEDR